MIEPDLHGEVGADPGGGGPLEQPDQNHGSTHGFIGVVVKFESTRNAAVLGRRGIT